MLTNCFASVFKDRALSNIVVTEMTSPLQAIERSANALPAMVKLRSGAVFYSGQGAFDEPAPLYVLGLNPGGSPTKQADRTIARDLAEWPNMPRHSSRYLDEAWEGKAPGTYGMQPRIRHMFEKLALDLRRVPASNVAFVRSLSEADLATEKATLLDACWPVHEVVMRELSVRTVLCLGGTAGRWVREKLGATRVFGTFRESNDRGWLSEAHVARDGRAVVTVTHPGRVDWRNPAADPTPLLRSVLKRDSSEIPVKENYDH